MKRSEFLKLANDLKEQKPEAIKAHGSVNAALMAMYQEQTGENVFRTFKAWKDLGYKVKKGSSSFPVFSRPLNVIKEEKGEETEETGRKRFGIAHLFHWGQVEPIEEEETVAA